MSLGNVFACFNKIVTRKTQKQDSLFEASERSLSQIARRSPNEVFADFNKIVTRIKTHKNIMLRIYNICILL